MTPQERAAARLRLMLEAGKLRQRAAHEGNACSRGASSDRMAIQSSNGDQSVSRSAIRGAGADRMAQLRVAAIAAKRARVTARMVVDSPPQMSGQKVNSAQVALNDMLLSDHHKAMVVFPAYREFIETRAATVAERLELGLRYQTRRFERASKARHISIWDAVRKHAETHKGPVRSPGKTQKSSTAGLLISLTGVGK